MKEVQIFSPRFIDQMKGDGYPVADIFADVQSWYLKQLALTELNGLDLSEGETGRLAKATAGRTLRNWTEFSEADIRAAAYDENRDQKLPEILQAIRLLAQNWLTNDLVPPAITAKEISRRTGFSPQRITGIITDFTPTVDGFGQKYLLEISDDGNRLPIKRAIKESRYQSRPPGGGPVQRARFQKRRLPGQLERLARERTKIEFFPVDSQPEFPKNPSGGAPNSGNNLEPSCNQDIVDVIQWLQQKGGKQWLRGQTTEQLTQALEALKNGVRTDVLVWNCLDFDWVPPLKRGCYPASVVRDAVETSIVNFNFPRLMETLEYFSLLGPITPIVLIPTNEALAPVWDYAQPADERKRLVNAVVNNLGSLLGERQKSIQVSIMQWDDYIKSRGVVESQENLTQKGADIFRRSMSDNPALKRDVTKSEREFFGQLGMTVKERAIEMFAPNYFGVYVGEGIAFSKIIAAGRPIVLIDFEEGRVAKAIAEGVRQTIRGDQGKDLPIISPVSQQEKLNYYWWKKDAIERR